jgi:cobalt/nickel transport system ATP-binding protein
LEEIVRVSNVRHVYPDGTTLHFRGVEFVVHQGERVALLGANGSGKTTLLYHIIGLLRPQSGLVKVFGHDPAVEWHLIRKDVGVLLQNPEVQIVAPRVRDDIGFSPRNYGVPADQTELMVSQTAELLEITHLLDRVPHYLSGGEKQKVALAGALVMKPRLLIMDEPFEGLDAASKMELVGLLNRLHKEKDVAMIVTVHDVNLAPYFIDTVYVMAVGGEIVRKGHPREIFGDPELMAAHRLEPPVLSRLFLNLRELGYPLGTVMTVEEATAALAALMGRRAERLEHGNH